MTEHPRRLRQQVLDRDQRECQLRLYGCTHNANDIYLTNPDPDRDVDAAMYVAVCPPCHATMTTRRGAHNRMIGDNLRTNRIRQ